MFYSLTVINNTDHTHVCVRIVQFVACKAYIFKRLNVFDAKKNTQRSEVTYFKIRY